MIFDPALARLFAEEITPLLGREGYSNASADKLLAAIGNWADVGLRLRWPYRRSTRRN